MPNPPRVRFLIIAVYLHPITAGAAAPSLQSLVANIQALHKVLEGKAWVSDPTAAISAADSKDLAERLDALAKSAKAFAFSA